MCPRSPIGRGDMKVYGPYKRNDGREHVILIDSNCARRTISYARYLLEQKLGHPLSTDKVVHHINVDPLDNNITNLEIMPRSKHASLHHKAKETCNRVCPQCGKSFCCSVRRIRSNQGKQGHAGPFCSRSCSSRYSRVLQLEREARLKP